MQHYRQFVEAISFEPGTTRGSCQIKPSGPAKLLQLHHSMARVAGKLIVEIKEGEIRLGELC